MAVERRSFLKAAAALGAASAVGAARDAQADPDGPAVLIDTTLCIGCRGCEAACAEANGLAGPERAGDAQALEAQRTTGTQAFTVVNRGERAGPDGALRYAKTQCLHCLSPACASACPARALEKTAAGPVVYHRDRCLGCRYCMVACPFGVPKYEYDRAVPYVRKCSFCAERQAQGLAPACTSVCPSGALTFGRRSELLAEAQRRIWQNPGKYVTHVYGEHEAGGTSWLYIGDVPFESLGLRAGVPRAPYPELTRGALAAVPLVMTLWPPLLMALHHFARERERAATEDGHE